MPLPVVLKKYRIFINIFILLILLIYCVKSITFIYGWFYETNNLNVEYSILSEQNKIMLSQIQNLQIKVDGLTEPKIDKEILETQAKKYLNLSKDTEFIIVN